MPESNLGKKNCYIIVCLHSFLNYDCSYNIFHLMYTFTSFHLYLVAYVFIIMLIKPCHSNRFSYIKVISMELSILYFDGLQAKISIKLSISVHEDCFYLGKRCRL